MQIRTRDTGRARPVVVFIALIALGVVLAACGAGASTVLSTVGSSVGEGQPAAQPVPAAQQPGGDAAAFQDDAKIIRTGSLQLEVADVAAALAGARQRVTALGGYIAASEQFNDGEQTVATVTYRIPSERWEDGLDQLRGLGELVGEQTDAAEVTDQIVDLDARIRNLKASETALVKHATNAARITDLLEIEERLSEVRGQIEQLTAQKTNLEDRATYATLTVTYGVEVAAIALQAERWDPQTEAERATASLVGVFQSLTTLAIWFAIVGLPMLILLAIVIGIALVVRRRLTRTVPSEGGV